MDVSSFVSLIADVLVVIGSSAVAAAAIPSKYLSFLNPIVQMLAANFGNAKNGN